MEEEPEVDEPDSLEEESDESVLVAVAEAPEAVLPEEPEPPVAAGVPPEVK